MNDRVIHMPSNSEAEAQAAAEAREELKTRADIEKNAIPRAISEWKQTHPDQEHRNNPDAGDWILERAEQIVEQELARINGKQKKTPTVNSKPTLHPDFERQGAQSQRDPDWYTKPTPQRAKQVDLLQRLVDARDALDMAGWSILYIQGPDPNTGAVGLTIAPQEEKHEP